MCVAGSEGAGGGVTLTDGSEGAGAGTEGTGGGVTWTDGSEGAGAGTEGTGGEIARAPTPPAWVGLPSTPTVPSRVAASASRVFVVP